MDVLAAARSRRSTRRFLQKPVPKEALRGIAEAAYWTPTTMNKQPLKFITVANPGLVRQIFAHTRWARLIPDGSAGPDESTQPQAYIAILVDKAILKTDDTGAGAAGMSILLAAEEQGIASCWLANIDRKEILAILSLDPERFHLHSIVALGYPAMRARAVQAADGRTDYYLESADCLAVPKRPMEEMLMFLE